MDDLQLENKQNADRVRINEAKIRDLESGEDSAYLFFLNSSGLREQSDPSNGELLACGNSRLNQANQPQNFNNSPYETYMNTNGSENDSFLDEFWSIHNVNSNVRLPPDMVIKFDGLIVIPKDKSKLAIIRSSARFTETLLKVLSRNSRVESVKDKAEELAIIASAHMKYLQEEVGQLHVTKSFGEETSRVYRSLRRNTTYFASPGVLGALQAAVAIAPASNNTSTYRGRGRGRGDRGSHYGNKGNYNQQNYGGNYRNSRGYQPNVGPRFNNSRGRGGQNQSSDTEANQS